MTLYSFLCGPGRLEDSDRSSFLLSFERKIFKRNTLQTAEIPPSIARFSYLSGCCSEVIFRLPHEIVILSTSNSSPKQFSNVRSLIPGTLEQPRSVPSLTGKTEARLLMEPYPFLQ